MIEWVLHHSVVVRAWSDRGEENSPAVKFFQDSFGRVDTNYVSVDLAPFLVQREVAELIRYPRLDQAISGSVLADLLEIERIVRSSRFLSEITWQTPGLQRSAFVLSAGHAIDLEHALSCALAEAMGVPLLVGDADLAVVLAPLTRLRPTLFVTLVDSLFF